MARFDHSGKTYGAIKVVEPKDSDASGPKTYWVDWLCCGKRVEMAQTTINMRKNEPSSQCMECRLAKKKGIEITVDTDPNAVEIPGWGKFYPIGRQGHRHGVNTARRDKIGGVSE